MEMYPDTHYAALAAGGDEGAFACLVDRYSRKVHQLILRLVDSREDAEELAQDVFMKVFRNLGSFKGECSFSTWIFRIAYNTAISATRKKRPLFTPVDEGVMECLPEVSEEGGDRIAYLRRAMEALASGDAAIIMLFYMEDRSVDDIASITGLSASNVKTRLHRIRKRLFVLITQNEGV
ncbi:MAG: sigma-70 family RNA polymerase sigma factor [Tannerellaceae bacterium]|jgi:RNA polymerase sigma-70 factor (ECF subfamily)|nr:sigma-70 family RNA polymerase sigma factor [Tannerellaceae bacterium]